MNNKNMIVLVAGSTGAGKTTIIRKLIEKLSTDTICSFPTCTTRAPREGEINGRDYLFFDKSSFNQAIKDHDIIEAKRVYNNFYGTHLPVILEKLESTKILIKDFDVQGYQNVQHKISRHLERRGIEPIPTITILIDAPDSVLLERVLARNDNTNVAERAQELIVEREYKRNNTYDYRIDNSTSSIDQCVEMLQGILATEYFRFYGEPLIPDTPNMTIEPMYTQILALSYSENAEQTSTEMEKEA